MTLTQWLAFAPALNQVYLDELGRSCFSDEQAFVAWTFHWREGGHDIEWIRAAIRGSDEWKQRHAGGPPPPPPQPSPQPSGGVPIFGSPSSGGIPMTADDMTIRPQYTTEQITAFLPGGKDWKPWI